MPVGAGSRIVPITSGWWERWRAWREHRPPQALCHAALEVFSAAGRHVVEMGPAWGGGRGRSDPGQRGVVATGPVGWAPLGRLRLFRYEVRCWRAGVLPDRAFAVAPPRVVAISETHAMLLLDRVAAVPRHTWGKDPGLTGDMWNSNALISWLLETSGLESTPLGPPAGCRAPGWRAGAIAAAGWVPRAPTRPRGS